MAKKKTKKTDENAYCVYIGPTIRGIVQSGQILHGDYSDACQQLAAAIERWPKVRNLIVTGEALAEARVKIKTPGNALYAHQKALIAQLAGN